MAIEISAGVNEIAARCDGCAARSTIEAPTSGIKLEDWLDEFLYAHDECGEEDEDEDEGDAW